MNCGQTNYGITFLQVLGKWFSKWVSKSVFGNLQSKSVQILLLVSEEPHVTENTHARTNISEAEE